MRPPAVGELRDSIDILNVTSPYGVDGDGTIVSTFASNVRAKIEPLGGDLMAETQEIQQYRQAYNIWIRYRSGVTAYQQIDYAGDRLAMTAPPEIIGRTWLLLHAEFRSSRNL